MNPSYTKYLFDIIRIAGLLSRSIVESNRQDFVKHMYELRHLADRAIQQHTFRVPDIEDEVDDDEL